MAPVDFPALTDLSTREEFPPVKIQIVRPTDAIFELLAAKAASPSLFAIGPLQGSFFQLIPPSSVVRMLKHPPMGSPTAIPSSRVKNLMLS